MNRILSLLTLVILTATACTKIESTELGQDVIPVVDGVNTFEQFLAVNTKDSIARDSIFPISSDNLVLGKISAANDPVFGETNAILNFELKPFFFPFGFAGEKTTRTVDSVVLVVSYRGFYGDTTIPQNLSVYELTEKISRDTLHKTTRAYSRMPSPLATAIIDPIKADDSLYMFREQAKNQIRIKLPNSFGTRFLNYDSAVASNDALVSDSLFKEKFKGFAIVSGGGKGLFYVNLLDTNTKVAFYYKSKATTAATVIDTTVTYFKFNQYFDGFSDNITRRATGTSEAGPYLASNLASQDTVLYIETAPGTHARLRIPGLSTFPNKIIHRAELLIEELADINAGTLLPDNERKWFGAPNLFVSATAPDSTRKFLIPYVDVSTSGINFSVFGGFPIKKTINGQQVNTYNINITRYVQGIVTRADKNLDLYLYAPFNESISYSEAISTGLAINSGAFNQLASGRIRIGGGANTKQAIRLRIIYSNL